MSKDEKLNIKTFTVASHCIDPISSIIHQKKGISIRFIDGSFGFVNYGSEIEYKGIRIIAE